MIEFEPFFVTPTGYKMCFMVYANGCGKGKGTHISVFTKTGAVNVELLLSKKNNSKHELVFTEIPFTHPSWLLDH